MKNEKIRKAVVFDNSGTLIHRYRSIKDLRNGILCTSHSSIDIVDQDPNRALIVLQTDPATCIINARPFQTIYEFISRNKIKIDISYSNLDFEKQEILKLLEKDKTQVIDIQDTIHDVINKGYNVQICSGSGFIANMDSGKIEFTITAGGKIFPEVPEVIAELKKRDVDIFVASGDRRKSLEELAKFIDIPIENIYDTANSKKKRDIVKNLKKKYKVMMVGNSSNDVLALIEADIGVLTLQQGDSTSNKVLKSADNIIYNIKDILDIDF